jgi:hypothetical protein
MINLANKIEEINTPPFTKNMLVNFPFQSLDLLDMPIKNETPRFYRETVDNMIKVSKFVTKD